MISAHQPVKKFYWPLVFLSIVILIWFGLKFVSFDPFEKGDENPTLATSMDKESCFVCHQQNIGFSSYHNPELIGCTPCHLGDPLSQDKDASHKGMVLIPGNLSDAEKTCGVCHQNELYKIQHSLMTTNSGLVAVDKFVFGETDSPDHPFDIRNIRNSAADNHLRDLCANCHIGAEKSDFGEINELSRGGGCNACHLNYSEKAKTDLANYLTSEKSVLPNVHPSTDIFVTDNHCFGCHSRSSRISTNYMGWHETLLNEKDLSGEKGFKVFEDKRVYSFQGEDIHHSKGLLCIDCHSSHEVMGDGKDYLHAEEAVKITCSDCHYKKRPNTISFDSLDVESALVYMHREYDHGDKRILAVKKDGHPLVNTYVEDDQVYLLGKKDNKKHLIKKQGVCSMDKAHQDLSCSSCHSQWAPRCIGCHNTYDETTLNGYDLLDKTFKKGSWIEHIYEFDVDLPAMGVREGNDHRKIEPAIPGMIMTLDLGSHDKSKSDSLTFHRLYAPNSPHTTSKEVRDCNSCHSNPAAIGYGKGKLDYDTSGESGKWTFNAAYEKSEFDEIPKDAWIPFLSPVVAKTVSTRSNFRPLNLKEQKQILLVGACLQCHSGESKIMQESLLIGIKPQLLKISKNCILP